MLCLFGCQKLTESITKLKKSRAILHAHCRLLNICHIGLSPIYTRQGLQVVELVWAIFEFQWNFSRGFHSVFRIPGRTDSTIALPISFFFLIHGLYTLQGHNRARSLESSREIPRIYVLVLRPSKKYPERIPNQFSKMYFLAGAIESAFEKFRAQYLGI